MTAIVCGVVRLGDSNNDRSKVSSGTVKRKGEDRGEKMSWGTLIAFCFLVLVLLAWAVNWWVLLALPLLLLLKVPMLLRRARVLAVLDLEYEYTFPPRAPQAFTLNQMERDSRKLKLNDHELATYFMAVMCNTLTSSDSLDHEQRQDQKVFCRKVHSNAMRLRASSVISEDLFSMLNDVVREKIRGASF
jgi:hypothetical protein